jgi:hypothetical protein
MGEFIAIRMPQNLMQNGFYVGVGNAGLDHTTDSDSDSTPVRIYFNVTPEGAIALMSGLTDRKFTTQESFGMICLNLASFAIAEINLEKPFLNPNSQGIYHW